jgi:hypothetical protein
VIVDDESHVTFQSLPKTSYYTMIDVWMMFCIQMLIATMMFHTYLNKLCKEAKQNLSFTEPIIVQLFSAVRHSTATVAIEDNKG